MDKATVHVMKNPYEGMPLKIFIVNPFTSSVLRSVDLPQKQAKTKVKVKGGAMVHKSKTIQLGDLSVFDKSIEDIKVEEVIVSTDGDASGIGVYPQDNIATLRDKIYVATGIPPYRQHIIIKDSKNQHDLTYKITAANLLVDVNLYNALQKHTGNTILNIPIDVDLINKKEDLHITMLDLKTTLLKENGERITAIIITDLFDILSPNNDDVMEVMSSQQQRDLIYYGFIIKYFPMLPYEGVVQVYEKKEDLSYLYPFLKQPYNKLRTTYQKEKVIMDGIYENSTKTATYIKSITKREIYSITSIAAIIRIPTIETRNAFDTLMLSDEYIYAGIKLKIGGHSFWVDKKYAIADNVSERFNVPRLLYDTVYILLNDGTKIQLSKDMITVEVRYSESDHMTFDMVDKNLSEITKPIINNLNKMGLLVITEGESIDTKELYPYITNTSINAQWPENCTSEQFSHFSDTLLKYEEGGILNVKSTGLGNYEVSMMTGIACCGPQKTKAILSQLSETWNQYDYYTIPEVHTKWNDMIRNNVSFLQKASNVTMSMSGFSKLEFQLVIPVLMGMMYSFSTCVCKNIIVKDTEVVSKRLKKLKGIDPDLYSLRRYDPDVQVYSVKCQSDRQPVIYKTQELRTLPQTIKNRLVKFWNFTEQKDVYYDCPNRAFPHLSFRPRDHPLGYCLPCCKKLVPSEDSRQAKIDAICHERHIIPKNEMDELIKKLEKDRSHILTYGKFIPVNRFSFISPLIDSHVLMIKSKYRLLGVKQDMPLFPDGGFIYSLLYILDVTMEQFAKDITKIITRDTYVMLDEGHTGRFESADQLKDTLFNMLVDHDRMILPIDVDLIDWINVISELVALAYGIHLILLLDYDGELNIRMLNSTQSALLRNCEENKFAIIVSHDNGTYPLIEPPDKIIFNCEHDKILASLKEVLHTEIKKVDYMGITLEIILEFADTDKEYKITSLLRGKRGLIYGAILNKNVYVPCIYSEYVRGDYKIDHEFPDTNKLKRPDLYKFIDRYNAFISKKHKNNLMMIDPVATLRHKGKYVGLRLRFVYDRYGMTIHHAPESTIGRYDVKALDVPYDIADVNRAISKRSETIVDKNVGHYAYQNYIYPLFLAEFAYDIRKFKNIHIRKVLDETLRQSNVTVDKREIRRILDKYPTDYRSIIEITSTNTPKKVISIIQRTIFDFDLVGLKKLRDLTYDKRLKEIETIMHKYVTFVAKTKKPAISNTLVSCTVDKELPQCFAGKLMIEEKVYHLCCEYLAKDLEVPYIFETISFKIIDTRNQLLFTRRKTEILRIKELD